MISLTVCNNCRCYNNTSNSKLWLIDSYISHKMHAHSSFFFFFILTRTKTLSCPMGARTVCFWGQLSPAETAGVDGRRSRATGNNTAAGYLMAINIQQSEKKKTDAYRFPKTVWVDIFTLERREWLMCLLQLGWCRLRGVMLGYFSLSSSNAV